MTVGEFLSERIGKLVFEGIMVVVVAVVLLTTGTQAGIVFLLGIICLLAFIAVQLSEYLFCRMHLRELEYIMEGLDKKYLFAECVPRGRNVYERKIFELSRRSGRAMITAVSQAEAARREYREYVESWVHEIKAPITAAGLICRNVDSENRHKISRELAQIEAHVERALFYARAESPEKDFIIRQVNLEELVAQTLSQYRGLLIQSGVRVETRGLEQVVFTDSKWTAFILGQLLQNAARYRRSDPVIILSAVCLGRQVQLVLEDNGIGIPAHELSRVFDRGFTGSNGRIRGGSTGMGLYLCKKLADELEVNLRITSKIDSGTKVTLTFPAREIVPAREMKSL